MAAEFLEALSLSRLAVFLRPESHLYLPGYKGAAFRGGFGYVFKNLACPTHETDCIHQRLGNPCVYSEVFETPVPAESRVMRKYPYAPHPFVLTPPNDRCAHFGADQELKLELVLVGRAINWLAYFIYTLEELGRRGVGPSRSRYRVDRVESIGTHGFIGNRSGTTVYDGGLRKVVGTPHVIKGSAFFSKSNGGDETSVATLSFETPARIVSSEHLATQLPFQTFMRSLLRRLALLTYFHCGQAVGPDRLRELIAAAGSVQAKDSTLRWRDWQRYSTRQKTQMKLGGLIGSVTYSGNLSVFVPYLRAGELAHVGKATSFGLGKYSLRAG
jgi:hypothetical protein